MIALKEFIDDVGGKNITVGAVLLVVSWVATDRYTASIEERFKTDHATFVDIASERAEIRTEIAKLRESQQTDEYERSNSKRLTVDDGAALGERISRLEKRMDEVIDVRRKDAR